MSVRTRTAFVLGIVGAWLAITVVSWALATASFSVAGDLAEARPGQPEAHAEWRAAVERPTAVARYQAAELNRWAFRAVGRARLVLGGLALLLAAWPAPIRRGAVVTLSLAALVAAVQALVLVPWAESAGRALAMAPDPRPTELDAVARSMGTVHALYGVADLAAVGLLLAAGWALAGRGQVDADAAVDLI